MPLLLLRVLMVALVAGWQAGFAVGFASRSVPTDRLGLLPLQAVMSASGKRFIIDKQSDPLDFLSWLVNALHTDLTGGKRKKRSGEWQHRAGQVPAGGVLCPYVFVSVGDNAAGSPPCSLCSTRLSPPSACNACCACCPCCSHHRLPAG